MNSVRLDSLGPFAAHTDAAADAARTVLRRPAFDTAEREGSALRPESREVERMALGALSMTKLPAGHPVWRQRPSRWHELSAAEQEVAVLAAAGWTNTAIAARQGSSNRTVDVQIAAVLHKLMIGTRADIAALVPPAHQGSVETAAARRPRPASRPVPEERIPVETGGEAGNTLPGPSC
ncbi:helix-turn-helix domain-containing protein [Nocardia sp. NPDC002869]|uniref:helix-turn-helix domain-containing protein n=1 Tax=Nocardia sp. NPDC002869 TaxID=3161032 RepID=UPI00398C9D13